MHPFSKSVAGKVGDARRIDLDKNALLRLDVRARLTGNEATFAAWFRPVDTRRKQVLFSQRTHTAGYVLLLEEARFGKLLSIKHVTITA